MAPPGCEVRRSPSIYEGDKVDRHLERRHLHPARARREAQRDSRFSHQRSHPQRAARRVADEQDRVSHQSRPGASWSAGRRATPVSPDARSSSIRTAAWGGTAAALSPAKIPRRLTAAPPTWAVGLPRTSWPPASRDRCEVQFAYAIGHPEPVSVHIDTFGTATVSEENIERAVTEVFSFKPRRHRRAARPASPDLLENHQLRPLRQERPRNHLGEDYQSGRAQGGGEITRISNLEITYHVYRYTYC